MRFQTPLIPATLLRRYKRFLADCRLEDGREVTAHVANPGSMMGLAEPGCQIWLEPNDDPKKKLKYGWRLVEQDNAFVCVDTGQANRVIRAALQDRTIAALAAYDQIRPEVPYSTKSRVDFLARADGLPDAYVEVKSVTLSRMAGVAAFPDSVTARGAKHLGDLADMARQGHRAVLLFAVMRSDAQRVTLAHDIDPAYAEAHASAQAAGVETLALHCIPGPQGIQTGQILPFAPQ